MIFKPRAPAFALLLSILATSVDCLASREPWERYLCAEVDSVKVPSFAAQPLSIIKYHEAHHRIETGDCVTYRGFPGCEAKPEVSCEAGSLKALVRPIEKFAEHLRPKASEGELVGYTMLKEIQKQMQLDARDQRVVAKNFSVCLLERSSDDPLCKMIRSEFLPELRERWKVLRLALAMHTQSQGTLEHIEGTYSSIAPSSYFWNGKAHEIEALTKNEKKVFETLIRGDFDGEADIKNGYLRALSQMEPEKVYDIMLSTTPVLAHFKDAELTDKTVGEVFKKIAAENSTASPMSLLQKPPADYIVDYFEQYIFPKSDRELQAKACRVLQATMALEVGKEWGINIGTSLAGFGALRAIVAQGRFLSGLNVIKNSGSLKAGVQHMVPKGNVGKGVKGLMDALGIYTANETINGAADFASYNQFCKATLFRDQTLVTRNAQDGSSTQELSAESFGVCQQGKLNSAYESTVENAAASAVMGAYMLGGRRVVKSIRAIAGRLR